MAKRVIGIETSCDDTGVAVYDSEQGLLAHVLYSQIETHAEYGGVVPELAARDHIRKVIPLVDAALKQAGCESESIDAIAYTCGPGLAGLVSGGHTLLAQVTAIGEYKILGETLDDAVGEAFDKTAKILGLGYPGGPAISRVAEQGDATRFTFPRPMIDRPGMSFSFSGLKTAALNAVSKVSDQDGNLDEQTVADIATAFQEAAVDTLTIKCRRALLQTGAKRLVVAGGVGANKRLREQLVLMTNKEGAEVFYPRIEFCTDNGAMIAYAGMQRLHQANNDLGFQVKPRWSLEELQPVSPQPVKSLQPVKSFSRLRVGVLSWYKELKPIFKALMT